MVRLKRSDRPQATLAILTEIRNEEVL